MGKEYSIWQSLKLSGCFVTFLWMVMVFEAFTGWSLFHFGIYPRESFGALGILFAPFIHGSAEHLAANSLALLILGSALLYGYPRSRWPVLIIIWLASGAGVWLFGRSSFHIGASGITHGLFFYLFFISLLRRDKRSIALMMIAFFMYGGMLMGIFPRDPQISFEYHLFGGAAGLVSAFMFRNWDPLPRRKVYDYERAQPEEEDAIGDLWQQRPPETSRRHWD